MGLLGETMPFFETMDEKSQCNRHCLGVKGWTDDKDDADDGQEDDYDVDEVDNNKGCYGWGCYRKQCVALKQWTGHRNAIDTALV